VGAQQTSVVIVNWNGAGFLPDLLNSLQQHDIREAIVVDNASSDESLTILQRYSSISVIRNSENIGYGAAANQGVETARADYVLLLNVDVVVLSGAISILQNYLDQNPDVAIASPQLLFPDRSLQHSIRKFPTPFSLALYLSYLDRVFPSAYRLPAEQHLRTHEVDQPMGAAMMLRKSAFKEVGMFDPKFFLYMEEVDLCYRLKQKGWKIVYLPEAKMIHHAGGSSNQDWERTQRNFLDSSKLYFDKHFPGSNVRLLLTPALLIRAMVLFVTGRFKQSKFYLREILRPSRPHQRDYRIS
jgi:GT2 family glycosyltransferase